MEIIYESEALEDIKYWKTTGNILIQQKISELIKGTPNNGQMG